MKVATAEFINNYRTLMDKALTEPIVITHDGRDRLVMLSAEEYARLKRRGRRVVRPERVTYGGTAPIAQAEEPAGAAEPTHTPTSPMGRKGEHHPLRGALKDVTRIPPGVDLTEPADPEWADRLDAYHGRS